MKKYFLHFFLFYSFYSFSQFQVETIDITTNDLVYDSNTNKIYVSIPSSNGSNGNSIGIINPETYQLENTVFIGSEPTILAISDNGEYIYSGFSGASIIRRFNVFSQTAGLQFSLGSDSSTGSFYAEDIEVMPNEPETIAVSRKNNGFSPRHEGIAIYDNNVMRPTTTPDHTGSNKIEFTEQNSLIGYNNETTEFGIRKHSINNDGVNNVSVSENVLSSFGLDFIYYSSNSESMSNKRMYANNGKVVDVTGTPFVIGSFANTNGPLVYDSANDKVCFASYDSAGNITFKRFNPNTFLIFDDLPITQAYGDVKNIVTCGENCYAFNTNDNKLVIVKDSSLGISDVKNLNTVIYPNPISDFLNIRSEYEIKKISVLNNNGRFIFNKFNNLNKIYLGNLSRGIYLLKITGVNNETITKKIIKK